MVITLREKFMADYLSEFYRLSLQ